MSCNIPASLSSGSTCTTLSKSDCSDCNGFNILIESNRLMIDVYFCSFFFFFLSLFILYFVFVYNDTELGNRVLTLTRGASFFALD